MKKKAKLYVLMFHSINEHYGNTPGHFISKKTFKNLMLYILKRYQILHPMKLKQFFNDSYEFDDPVDKFFLITFDDGYRNFYKYAYPVLTEYNIPALIFIVPSYIESRVTYKMVLDNVSYKTSDIGKQIFLTRQELLELSKNPNIVIGSHTFSHKDLSRITKYSELIREIEDSKKILSDMIGYEVVHFSYPWGRGYNIPLVESLVKQFYDFAFLTIPGVNTPETSQYRLKRIEIYSQSFLPLKLSTTVVKLREIFYQKIKGGVT